MTAARGALALGLVALAAAAPPAGDPAAAARQYRAARRLAAEGSAEARRSLERVIEVDPQGELADDALVDLALLEAPARWPERTGGLDAGAVARALALVGEALERFPSGDRAPEARYQRALLHLEPAVSYAPETARADLIAVVRGGSSWSDTARYALAWLDEQSGDDGPAFDAYQRLLVDVPADESGLRARVGAARVLLRRGEFGAAARRLQEAIDAGVPVDARALVLRELAVRALLRDAGAADPVRPERHLTGVRSPSALVPTASGGTLVTDPRQGRVIEFDANGNRVGDWSLAGVQAIAADAAGRGFAAAGETLHRLERGRTPAPLAALGDYAPLAQLVTDGGGGFWLLERRGRRIGRIDPGAAAPTPLWEDPGARLSAMVWDGRRLVAIDSRSRTIVALGRDGLPGTVVDTSPARFVALGADATGRVALLDGRTGAVGFFHGDDRLEPPAATGAEISGPVALGLGPEGELHLLDREGVWTVLR